MTALDVRAVLAQLRDDLDAWRIEAVKDASESPREQTRHFDRGVVAALRVAVNRLTAILAALPPQECGSQFVGVDPQRRFCALRCLLVPGHPQPHRAHLAEGDDVTWTTPAPDPLLALCAENLEHARGALGMALARAEQAELALAHQPQPAEGETPPTCAHRDIVAGRCVKCDKWFGQPNGPAETPAPEPLQALANALSSHGAASQERATPLKQKESDFNEQPSVKVAERATPPLAPLLTLGEQEYVWAVESIRRHGPWRPVDLVLAELDAQRRPRAQERGIEAETLEAVRGHWFIQGGQSEFGELDDPDGCDSADTLVANILRLVRAKSALSDTPGDGGHTHAFTERLTPGVDGDTNWRCQCGARLWVPAGAPER